MEFLYDIRFLSQDFLNDYPADFFPELMGKEKRSYNALLIDTHMDYYICIPYRSMIKHKNAYMFKTSKRAREKKSGLDFSKMVLLSNSNYLGGRAVIDQDEYKETSINIKTIVKEAVRYIDDYVNHINGRILLNRKQFERKYKFSTLPYFHNILKLNHTKNKM